MNRDRTFIGFISILLFIVITAVSALGQTPMSNADIDGKIKEATSMYRRAQFEDAVILTSSLLSAGQKLRPEQEKDALLILAMSEVNRMQDNQARAYLQRLADLDPTVELTPDEYPPQMMKIWYSVERNIPDSLRPSIMNAKTIAVLYFDNASISEDQAQLSPLCKGLPAMMIQDITKAGNIRVVERDRINFLVDELRLQQSDLTDKSTAVKMGKLVGAQTLLMGGFMKLDNKNFKIYGRLVSVETGEIIKAEEVSGKPDDIFELQKELVFKILDDLNIEVKDEAKKEINKGNDAQYEALYHYSLGLALQDKNDYVGAYAQYKEAIKLAPGFAEAQVQKDRIEPLALKG